MNVEWKEALPPAGTEPQIVLLFAEEGNARDQLLETLAHLEAWIDFPEEDIDPQTGVLLRGRVNSVLAVVDSLLATADQGRVLREGVRTVIFGEPNVGKSSLLSLVAGARRIDQLYHHRWLRHLIDS